MVAVFLVGHLLLPDRLCRALQVDRSIWRRLDILYSTAAEEMSTMPVSSYELLLSLDRIAAREILRY